MSTRHVCRFLVLGAVLLAWCSAAGAAPLGWIFSAGQVDADPNKDFLLTDQNGPWMILACSFSGEHAQEQAKQLALELRKYYKLEAYVHKARFEFEEVHGRGLNRYGAPMRMKLLKDKPEIEEYAVLVGNYRAVDDPEAQRTLQKIKYTQPKCLEVREEQPTAQSLSGWRMIQKEAQKQLQQLHAAIKSEQAKLGPMGHAMITTNPRLPKEFFVSTGLDPLVVEMNREVPHSLLDCPGAYTVLVATFKGHQSYTRDDPSKRELGASLAEAAEKAHKLTEALRMKNYEAYEFHDRYASIVTVGSFDSVGTPRANGKIEINPALHKVMEVFKPEPVTAPGAPAGATQWKGLVGIPFDFQPVPVQVPKRSISETYTRR